MVHQYKNNGYNMVLDVASGSVHVVDDLTYEVIALYEDHTLEEIIKELSSWDEKDVKESYGEVTELKDAGVLFTEDCYEEYICGFKDRPTVVKALHQRNQLPDFYGFLNSLQENLMLSYQLQHSLMHVFPCILLLLRSSIGRQGYNHVQYEDRVPLQLLVYL